MFKAEHVPLKLLTDNKIVLRDVDPSAHIKMMLEVTNQ